jgi:hypothetical protein
MTAAVETRLRRALLLLAVLGLGAALIELLLEDHYQEPLQFIPFGLCAIGLPALVAALARPSAATLRVLRWVMLVVALGGALGVTIHLLGNFNFEQEVHPTLAIGQRLINTLKGADPLLAPGSFTFAALLALLATYAHPALER